MTRNRINLLPYLALNAPPRAMLNSPSASTPNTANSAMMTITLGKPPMAEIYRPGAAPASGNTRAGGLWQ